MQALKFNLSGKTAIFKRPDVNDPCLFTYSHIHKPALLGILGAICGFGGYNQQKAHNDKCLAEKRKSENLDYPEFYEKLKDIKVSIIPKSPTFPSLKHTFNNSVGYANYSIKKYGGGSTLCYTEQWLENPSWEIFILLDGTEVTENLKQRFLNREFVYIPYLGKNDHFANITDIEVVEIESVQNCKKIDSMIFAKNIDKAEKNIQSPKDRFNNIPAIIDFKYTERLPIALDKEDNLYVLEKFVYTNMVLTLNNFEQIYSCNGKNIAFF